MKTIYLTKKQVEGKKKEIDEIILANIPIELTLTFFLTCKRRGKAISNSYNWERYEKKIDGEVAKAKKILKNRIGLYSIADGKKKLLDNLLRDGKMTTKNKKYILNT
jgi:hypothetical protein